jgi:aminoglycoside phosphotransferase (APT) family kinase protein
MAATALPRFDRILLARFLVEASGARNVGLTEPALLSGGAIRENWGLDAEFVGGPFAGRQHLVLRTDGPTGIPSSLGRIEEFSVLQAAHAAGVTVPEPLWACADPDVIGKPFFVMRRVDGTAQGRRITADPVLEPALPVITARLAQELAKLQTIRPPRADLAFLPMVGAAEHVAAFRAYLDRHAQPRPALEWAIRWLEMHIPEKLPPVLCHRDFRTGNYMIASTPSSPACAGGSGWRLTGILDWEFAGWGDPDEDIGWLCCKGWRFARLDREAGGIADRTLFYRAYENASGRRLDPERVRFWEVLANVRWAVIALQQSDRHLLDGTRDLSTAIIGRRATECELELLMLLDTTGAPDLGPRASRPPACGQDARGPEEVRDQPNGAGLLALGREMLLAELLPLVPTERHRDVRLIATAMAIAERESLAGDAPQSEIAERLAEFYGAPASSRQRSRQDAGAPRIERLLARLADDLRNGAFEACEARGRAARAILWRLTILKLREGNPGFLARNGFGA